MSEKKNDPYDDFLTVFTVSNPFQRWNANPLPPSIKDPPEKIPDEPGPQPNVDEISGNWLQRTLKKTAQFLTGR